MTIFKIGLDLAQNTVGYAVRLNQKITYDSLVLSLKEKKELDDFDRVERLTSWVFTKLSAVLKKPHELILEDIFLGTNAVGYKKAGRTQGAFIHHYRQITGQKPKLIMAITARKEIEDLRTRASKAEIQVYVVDRFNLGEIDGKIRKIINDELNNYQTKKISTTTFKSRMTKVSKIIAKDTGVDEHMADAIILTVGDN